MATKNILFTESWQEYEIGSYPMARVTYAEGAVYKPSNLKGMTGAGAFDMGKMAPAFSKINGQPGAEGVYVLPSLLFGSTWELMINKPDKPFMEFSSRSFSVTERGLYHPPGFDVVACPTRPGRKRLKFPGDKLFGAVGSNVTDTETASGRTNLIRLSFVASKPVISKSYSIAFVVRFPQMATWDKPRPNAWIFSVAEPDYYPVSPTLAMGTSPFQTMHPREPFLLFGNASGFRVGGNPADTQLAKMTSNAEHGLPWLRFKGVWGSDPGMEEVPNPLLPGEEGNYFKFEYDRDYFIEIRIRGETNPTSLAQAPIKTIYIDGVEIVKNAIHSYQNGPVVIPANARKFLRTQGFSFNFSSGAAKGQILTTDSGEKMGSVVLSDIIWSEMDVSDDSFTPWPASTRVWGEDPNSDVEVSLQNTTGGSNASVAGKSATSWVVGRDNVELVGKAGAADSYKTDGSSLPDFAGNVIAVHTRAVIRPDAEDMTVSLTQGENVGGEATIPASDSAHYSVVDYITRTLGDNQWSPQTAADTPFGIKIKG